MNEMGAENCGKLFALLNKMLHFNSTNCTFARQFTMDIFEQSKIDKGAKFSIMYIAICLPLLLLQITTFPIFFQKVYRKNVCFRILFANGCADSIQLGTVLIFSILNLFMSRDGLSKHIQRIGGAIAIPIWSIVVIQHLLLALNRLLVFMRAHFPEGVVVKYLPNEKREKRIFNIALLFCFCPLYLALVALFLSPLAGMELDRATMVFRFDDTHPYTRTFQAVNWWCTSWIPFLCFFIYSFIIWEARKYRTMKAEAGGTKNAVDGAKSILFSDFERRLLIQAIILYSIMALLILAWHLFDHCQVHFVDSFCTANVFGIEIVQISLGWHSVIVEGSWMVFCGLSPILLLTMNKQFRTHYFQFYTYKSANVAGHQQTMTSTF